MTELEHLTKLIESAMYWGADTPEKIAERLIDEGVICPKKIPAYEDYTIDECGNVYSRKSRRYLSQQKRKDGYYYVDLCKNGKRKYFAVHRLVAVTFVENGMNYPQVNHKDEDKTNNNADNLEWCDEKYNSNYGTAQQRKVDKICKPVVCIETGTVFLTQREASKLLNVSYRHISDCCKGGRRYTCGGYHWRYATREEAEAALAERRKGKC